MGNCCINCFEDENLREIVLDNGCQGDCEYCGSEEVLCVDTASLTDTFLPLMHIYDETTYGEHYGYDSDPNNYGDQLHRLIQSDWSVFSDDLDDAKMMDLLWDILDLEGDPDDPVDRYSLYSCYDKAFTHVESSEVWNEFCQEVKFKKRFFTEYGWEKALAEPLEICRVEIEPGRKFYRARLGGVLNKKRVLRPYPVREMGAPPKEKSKNNRANPEGIVYFYCATNDQTALAELRPWKTAQISVATVKVTRELSIVDLTDIPYFSSPFGYENLRHEIETRDVLRRLGEDMSKPVDPNAVGYEYAPTQYLSELIKHLGFDGIIFKSSLGPDKNVVIFDPSSVKITSSRLYKIDDISYSFTKC